VLCLLGEDGCSRGQVILINNELGSAGIGGRANTLEDHRESSEGLGIGVRELVLASLGGFVAEGGAQKGDVGSLVGGYLSETTTDPMMPILGDVIRASAEMAYQSGKPALRNALASNLARAPA
jgi:hypothetical protein